MNNNMECNYDGGDCCGPSVNTQYCTYCQCIEGYGNGTTGNGTILGGNIYSQLLHHMMDQKRFLTFLPAASTIFKHF